MWCAQGPPLRGDDEASLGEDGAESESCVRGPYPEGWPRTAHQDRWSVWIVGHVRHELTYLFDFEADHLGQGQRLYLGCDPDTEGEVWMDLIAQAAAIGMNRPTQGRIIILAVPQVQSLDEDNDKDEVYAMPEAR